MEGVVQRPGRGTVWRVWPSVSRRDGPVAGAPVLMCPCGPVPPRGWPVWHMYTVLGCSFLVV